MRGDRYEKVRADWLLAHEASWHLSDRRMATQLAKRAAQKDRSAAGATESSHHEGQIKPLMVRFMARGEDSKETMYRYVFVGAVAAPALVLLVGPAVVASMVLYGLASTLVLKLKRAPRSWPWLLAAVLVGVGGWLVVQPSVFLSITPWPFAVHVDSARFLAGYGLMQGTLALLLTAWQVRRRGWPGVKIKGKTKTPKTPSVPTLVAPTLSTPVVASAQTESTVTLEKTGTAPAAPSLPTTFEPFEEVADDEESREFAGWMTGEEEETDAIEGETSNV